MNRRTFVSSIAALSPAPAVLLRSDEKFQVTGQWEFNASVGIASLDHGRFLIAQNTTLLAGKAAL